MHICEEWCEIQVTVGTSTQETTIDLTAEHKDVAG